MSISSIKEARCLANYIKSNNDLVFNEQKRLGYYNHIGALLADASLQAGLNYKNIVKPRVERIVNEFPETYSLKSLVSVIEKFGTGYFLNWNHEMKIKRFERLIEFCLVNEINDCDDFRCFFNSEKNRLQYLEVNGVGYKTLDYTLKLLSFDTIAVDRHIIAFVEESGLVHSGYYLTKKVVEYAADLLGVSRSSLDAAIWAYMSDKDREVEKNNNQLELSLLF